MWLIGILRVGLIIGAIWIVWWAITSIIKIRRQDKIEKLHTAREETEATLKAGAVAGNVTDEDRAGLEDAQRQIADRVDLGKKAK